jgi:hypothetical protein
MASKKRRSSSKQALSRQRAETRRRAPGKRYVGENRKQSIQAKEAQRRTVARLVEVDAATRRAEEIGVPISAVMAELVDDAVKLARTLLMAPLRLTVALIRTTVQAPA